MDRIRELLSRISELSDDELQELRDLVLQEFDRSGQTEDGEQEEGEGARVPAEAFELSILEELAEASAAIQTERDRRTEERRRRDEYSARIKQFRDATGKTGEDGGSEAEVEAGSENASEETGEPAQAAVPDDRKPRREVARTTVIRAGADLPGFPMGTELTDRDQLAQAMVRRIQTMRGLRGGDGDKMIVASAFLDAMPEEYSLRSNEAEENLRKVQALTAPHAIVAAGGLAAPEEARYDLFGVGVTDRPIRDSLPVFTTRRGGVRFMRPPTLNDVQGAVGVWTVQDDIDAVTNDTVRKPSFRIDPGPEIVVDTQAITMILTFGNLASRAYPEMVARHNELGMISHARVAEQQLLTQIGALSTAVSGRAQALGATREVLMQVDQAAASYKNRHRTGQVPLRAIMPVWFLDMLRSDIVMQHPGDGLDVFAMADAQIQAWFSARNINITWAMDGEAGQDYAAITSAGTGVGGTTGIAEYPESVLWYLYADGTFAFMDGGTLDLGLVRDSTLNSANDYQMFVETFENVVKFGNEALRVTSYLTPLGAGMGDATYAAPALP